MLRLKTLDSLVIIFVLTLSVKLADGASLYKAPSDINVFVGESFNLTCGITDVKSSKSLAWVRVKNGGLSFVSREENTYWQYSSYEVSLIPDYTVIITNATSSLSGVYQCGVAINTGGKNYTFNTLATITVSVLESGRTTPISTTIQPIQATSLTTEISQPAMSEETTEQTTASEMIIITNDTHMIETTPSSELLDHNGKGDITVGLVFISCITFLGIYMAY